MAGFLYFLPELHGATLEDIKRVGLDLVVGKAKFSFRESYAGPGGKQGVVIAIEPSFAEATEGLPRGEAAGRAARCGYYPDSQEWSGGPGEKYWIGFEKENPPGPADLQREETVAGHFVRLADGKEWLIPVAKSIVQETGLPKKLRIGPEGKWVKEELPRFYELCRVAEEVWETFEAKREMPFERSAEIAAIALAVNYRLGPDEISATGLFETDPVTRVLQALVDIPAIIALTRAMEDAAKKKRDSSQSDLKGIKDGKTDLSPDISQPSQTSPG